MKFAKILLFALIALLYTFESGFAQQNRAREDYGYLKLLPRYSNDNAAITVTRYDFTIKLRDGVIIDALKFIPQGTPPAGGWPTVIFVHGYGDNKETLAGFAKAQAEYGYYTATFSMRGQGNSGGLSNLISTTEAQDMIEFITAIKKDSVKGSSPNNILVMGGSQGGLVPYMASCMGMKVKTIISALAPPNFASSWIENGSIKMTFLWTIEYTSDTARYTPQVDRMSNWVYANTKPYWDSLAAWLPPNRDFMNIVVNNKVPLIMEGSWQDKFFNASGIMKASDLNTNSFFRLYIGAVQGHGGDHSTTEDTWHMNFFNEWFFYWLFNQQNGMLNKPKYEIASTTYPVTNNYWTFVHDSLRVPLTQNILNNRYYFSTGGKLSRTASASGQRSTLRNQVTGGLTMQEAVNEEFTGTVFNSKFVKRSVTFTTDPLTKNYKWLGTPKINLSYSSTASTFVQYNFQVYEVQTDGTQRLINRINYTDRNYTANQTRVKNFEGQAHSHIFKIGNRIRIVATNLDTSPEDVTFFGTNPFVLPILNNGYHYINLNSSSYIDMPITALTPLANLDMDTDNNCLPLRFSLEQNYPNPFNPATYINFTIPESGLYTELNVFDITGREVKTILKEQFEQGRYNILFDGTGFASGVYFYTLRAGNFYDVKKMILVK